MSIFDEDFRDLKRAPSGPAVVGHPANDATSTTDMKDEPCWNCGSTVAYDPIGLLQCVDCKKRPSDNPAADWRKAKMTNSATDATAGEGRKQQRHVWSKHWPVCVNCGIEGIDDETEFCGEPAPAPSGDTAGAPEQAQDCLGATPRGHVEPIPHHGCLDPARCLCKCAACMGDPKVERIAALERDVVAKARAWLSAPWPPGNSTAELAKAVERLNDELNQPQG